MFEVISKVLPIILLTMSGLLMKKFDFIGEETIGGIKKLILNICLPSTLFVTFLNLNLQMEYLVLMVFMMVLFFLLYITGGALGRFFNYKSGMSEFFSTGFAFGLVGIPLFSIVFGEENMGLYSVMGLSHEIFVWFIYFPVLSMKLGGKRDGNSAGVFKSPLNISVFLGVLFNVMGLGTIFQGNFLLAGMIGTLRYLGSVNAPLILICIGYGMNFDKTYMAESIKLSVIRVITTFSVGYIFKWGVLDRIGAIDGEVFSYSFFTLIVLPPIFSLSLFLSKYGRKEQEQVISNATVHCTILSMVLFVGYNILRAM